MPLDHLPCTQIVRSSIAQPRSHNNVNALTKQLAEHHGDEEGVCRLEARHDAIEKSGYIAVLPGYVHRGIEETSVHFDVF
jgi:hypothetical protein